MQKQKHFDLTRKVLLSCEDEGVQALMLHRYLNQLGFTRFRVVAHGREAIEFALRQRPDILLLDVHLPHMSGWEVARAILQAYSPCVVMLTGYPKADHEGMCRALGVHGYIVKPVVFNDLVFKDLEEQLRDAFARYCKGQKPDPPRAHKET